MQYLFPIDIHTVVFEADVRLLELQILSAVHCLEPLEVGIYRININGSTPDISASIQRVIEERILPRLPELWRAKIDLQITPFGHPRGGPRSQQILKLTSVAQSQAARVLVLDAKNHFLRPISLQQFFAEDYRIKTVIKAANKTFTKAVAASYEFFGLPSSDEPVLPTITPYVMVPDVVRGLLEEIAKRAGSAVETSFDKNTLLRDSTEFFLYFAYLKSRNLVDRLYVDAPPTFLSLFTTWPQDRKIVSSYLDRAMSDSTVLMFGLHRHRLPQLNHEERSKLADLWKPLALPEPASYYLEQYPWTGDPVSEAARALPRIEQSQGGLQLLLDPVCHVDRYILNRGAWEAGQVEKLSTLATEFHGDRHDMMFLDVGSFWGLYALLAWKSDRYRDVVAFEADPHNYSQLMAQLFLNRASYDIDVRHMAVSDHAGQIKMMRSVLRGDGNRGTASVLPDESERRHSIVRSGRLDDELPNIRDRALVIKIDVEGHEAPALEGMRRLLTENSVVMQIELYDTEGSTRAKAILAELGLREIGRIEPDHYYTNVPA